MSGGCDVTGPKRAGLRNSIGLLFGVALLTLFAAPSLATSIQGSILINGGVFTDSDDLLNATELTFSTATVLFSVGDFPATGVRPGDPVTFITNPLSLTPTLPTDLWSVGSFTFQLTTLVVEEQSATALVIAGNGMIVSTLPGLDAVEALWRLSTQTPGQPQRVRTLFSFSSSAVAVPEPSSFILVAMGLTGLVVRRSRERG